MMFVVFFRGDQSQQHGCLVQPAPGDDRDPTEQPNLAIGIQGKPAATRGSSVMMGWGCSGSSNLGMKYKSS